MAIETIKIPDIGGATDVDVIEVCVNPGDSVAADDSLIVLESDKASMDIPAPSDCKIVEILVKEGDKVSEGDDFAKIETGAAEAAPAEESATESAPAPAAASSASSTSSSSTIDVNVPDIGGAEGVDVIEVCVAVGDSVEEGDSVIVLESDKASMEIPSPAAGKVSGISIKEGDKVSEGAPVLVLEVAGNVSAAAPAAATETPAPAAEPVASSGVQKVEVPDIGGAEGVDVIEVCVAVGDEVSDGDSLIVLESDKASMEIPAPAGGKIVSLSIKEGDKVSMGTLIGEMETAGAAPVSAPSAPASAPAPAASKPAPAAAAPAVSSEPVTKAAGKDFYAGPAVRKLARQMAVDLSEVSATGPRGRIQKDDIKVFVKKVMTERAQGGGVSGGSGIPAVPAVDFSKFGEIELVKMSKIKKVTAENMSRNWLNVPHVTQFDDVDISELESFRKGMKAEAEKAGVKLTPLPFLVKACAAALKAEPSFNVSLHSDGEHIVQKNYVHIGVAVDTPIGLMVPVIRDADKKGLYEIAEEMMVLAKKARDGKLMPKDMQGGCFTISSLGAIGGTGFTPIVNAPEVAILGVSRAEMKPKWNGSEFVPKLMMPLSLSYDHRAINGGDAGRFFTYLNSVLSDIRKLLL